MAIEGMSNVLDCQRYVFREWRLGHNLASTYISQLHPSHFGYLNKAYLENQEEKKTDAIAYDPRLVSPMFFTNIKQQQSASRIARYARKRGKCMFCGWRTEMSSSSRMLSVRIDSSMCRFVHTECVQSVRKVLSMTEQRERAQRVEKRCEIQRRLVEAQFTIDLSRLYHHKMTLGKDRYDREYNLIGGDASTVFVLENHEKSWSRFDAKENLTELLKWLNPDQYESEVVLYKRLRTLKDAHENDLVPSKSTMTKTKTFSIGFDGEIETLVPERLRFVSDLSCNFCGYQAPKKDDPSSSSSSSLERHCRWCHTTFLLNNNDVKKKKKSVEKFIKHEKRCAKNRHHKQVASMCIESLNRLGMVKSALSKMELALTYLNALRDKNQDSGRVAWHEYLKRAISPEMVMECLLNLQSRLKNAWLDEKWLSLGTHIELGSKYFDPEDTIPPNLCIAMKFGHSIAGVETYRRMLARAIRNPRTSNTPRNNSEIKKRKIEEIAVDGGQF